MREEKEREAQIRFMDFKNLEKKYSSELQKLQGDSLVRIQKEVQAIADEIGKKEGYLLIIEKREAGVFYAPAAVDITEKLIQQYNTKAAPKTGK
jgi:outer membrane protein